MERGNQEDANQLIAEDELSMEEAGAELERARENKEDRNQMDQEEE
jgi:hypothetical protein